MNDGAAAIRTVELTKRFPKRRRLRPPFRTTGEKLALDRVSLTIRPGEVFGLLGPNGAGKTTLVKILSTLTLPTRGTALVGDLDVVKHSREVRRRIGVIYGDERSFFWRLSVLENLRFYASLYGLPGRLAEPRIRDLLDLVGLTKDATVQMHHFSTGMKQRAAIARGLLNDPGILFMDEPTRGLDPVAALELRRFVGARVANGDRTVLVATHSMAEAEELCHRVAFLHAGRVQLLGTIEQLRGALRPEDVHVIEVSGLDAGALPMLSAVPGVRGLTVRPKAGTARDELEVVAERGSAAVPTLVRAIVEAGGSVWSCVPRELSLEEMFAIAMERARPGAADGLAEAMPMLDRTAAVDHASSGWQLTASGDGHR